MSSQPTMEEIKKDFLDKFVDYDDNFYAEGYNATRVRNWFESQLVKERQSIKDLVPEFTAIFKPYFGEQVERKAIPIEWVDELLKLKQS